MQPNNKDQKIDALKIRKLSQAILMALGATYAINPVQAGPGKVYTDGVIMADGTVKSTTIKNDPNDPNCPSCSIEIPTFYANSPILRKFVDELPGLSLNGKNLDGTPIANNLGQHIPVAVAESTNSYPNSDYFELAVVEYKQQMHSDLKNPNGSLHPTRLRGYVQIDRAATNAATPSSVANNAKALKYPDGTQIYLPKEKGLDANGVWDHSLDIDPLTNKPFMVPAIAYDQPHYLGPVIVASKGRPTRIKMNNLLPQGAAGDMFLPVDESLSGVNPSTTAKYPQNRAAIHLHGGDSPWISDGTPNQWFSAERTVDGSVIPEAHRRGDRAFNVPDMPYPGEAAQTLFWPNDQSARLMWYHDHTFGLTRQNAYAGMAAGYLITDPAEDSLLSGVIPGQLDMIPLIIQDKTFVPNDINTQDALWQQVITGTGATAVANHPKWGEPGDLWYPHVYEPVIINNAGSLMPNPAGRWDYLPTMGGTFATPLLELPEVSATPEAYNDTAMVNGVAYPTMTVEPKAYRIRFLNGANDRYLNLSLWQADAATNTDITGYPTGVAQQTEVKMVNNWISTISISNGGSGYVSPTVKVIDRDTSGVTILDGQGNPVDKGFTGDVIVNGGVITGVKIKTWGANFINPQVVFTETTTNATITAATATAALGLTPAPDQTTAGPAIIQFGNEAGLFPKSVTHNPKPMELDANGVVVRGGFYLANAERADTIIDFSKFAGQTLILYNDSTAPVPGGDPNYDYYTGGPDKGPIGGAPSTQPGYGPNTRTIMQIKVANSTPATAFDPSALDGKLANFYTPSSTTTTSNTTAQADALIANVTADGAVNGTLADVLQNLGITQADLKVKTIEGLQDVNFGRLIANFTTEDAKLPGGANLPLAYIDKPTDIIADGDTQYWYIKNVDMDNHPIHFHLFNVQVLGRVDQDATQTFHNPLPTEAGWKETVQNWPGQNVLVAVRPKTPQLPFGLPNSVRLMDPNMSPGATSNESLDYSKANGNLFLADAPLSFVQYDIDPNTGKLSIPTAYTLGTNESMVNIGGELYVLNLTTSGSGYDPNATIPNTIPPKPWRPAVTVSATYTDSKGNPITAQIATGEANVNADGTIGSITMLTSSNNSHPTLKTTFTVDIATSPELVPGTPATAATATLTPWLTLATGSKYKGNEVVDYAWEYVFHCHILGHEENDLMRPLVFKPKQASPIAPTNVGVAVTGDPTAKNPDIKVSWVDSSPADKVDAKGTVILGADTNGVLTKNNPANEIGFLVQRAEVIDGTVKTWETVPAPGPMIQGVQNVNTLANATSLADTLALKANTDYQYRVQSVNQLGLATDATQNASLAQLPAVPSALTAVTVGYASVDLSWTDNSSNETNFTLEQSSDGVNWSPTTINANLASKNNGNVTVTHSVTGLKPTTAYQFRVSATNALGNSASSAILAVTTTANLNASVKLNATAAATQADGTTPVTLTWDNSLTGSVDYKVERSVNNVTTLLTTPAGNNGSFSLIDNNTLQGTITYTVTPSVNGTLGTASSQPVTIAAHTPAVPTALAVTASATAGSVDISWLDNSVDETSFELQRAEIVHGVVGAFSAATSVPGNTTKTTVSVPGNLINANTDYQYKVFAKNGALQSADVLATFTQLPLAPTSLAIQNLTPRSLRVVWSDAASNEDGYVVEYSGDAGKTWTPATVSPGFFADITGLTPGVNYLVRVGATKATFATPYTQISATTPAELLAVGNLTGAFNAVGAPLKSVSLSWLDNSTAESGYLVQRSIGTLNTKTGAVTWSAPTSLPTLTSVLAPNLTKYVDSGAGVVNNTLYQYSVSAVSGVAAAQVATVNTGTATTLPVLAQVQATGTITTSSVAFQWQQSTSALTNGYEVQRCIGTKTACSAVGAVWQNLTPWVMGLTNTKFTDNALKTKTTYNYRVRAINSIVTPAVTTPASTSPALTSPWSTTIVTLTTK